VLNGQIDGDVYSSEHVELAPRARIIGDVYYHLIEMSMGATLNGNLIHQEGGKPKLEFKKSPSGQEETKDTVVSPDAKGAEGGAKGREKAEEHKTA
jgi:cytoskeletal protein CcmA (bactofilin family)